MKQKFLGISLAIATTFAATAFAQEKPGPMHLAAHAIKGGVYWVEGGRSNTGFIIGNKGVVIIDAQMTPEGVQNELAEIAKITPKPIHTIVITHADPDHVAGLPSYPANVAVIMQENTKSEILVSAADPKALPIYTAMYGALLKLLPNKTIGASENVVIDGIRMTLMYVAPAHTSGDLIVYLPVQKIVFTGDIVTTNTGAYPVIHFGGSSLGWIAAMKAMLALNADTYVTGHGAFESKAQLQERLRYVEQRREQIKAMVNDNKSLADVEQAFPEPGASPLFMNFTQSTYAELSKGYPPASPPWSNLIQKQ